MPSEHCNIFESLSPFRIIASKPCLTSGNKYSCKLDFFISLSTQA